MKARLDEERKKYESEIKEIKEIEK